MSKTLQQRRARVDAAMGTPPTIEQVTTAREAQTAVNLAATAANRAGRHELRKQAPDWPLQRANFPKDKR